MASGIPDDAADRLLDKVVGPAADTTILGAATLYMDLLVAGADDDNGTGVVSWDQGRVAVDLTDAAVWPVDATGRAKTTAVITSATNTSGDTISVVAFAFYDDAIAGSYRGGGPLAGDSIDVDDGTSLDVVITLSAPPPDDA